MRDESIKFLNPSESQVQCPPAQSGSPPTAATPPTLAAPRPSKARRDRAKNAFKHGLTGEGVALPTEDTVEIERRFGNLVDELQPSTEAGRILLHRFSFLSVRLDRCERHETTVLSKRVRDAIDEYDDQRMADIELHASRISSDPMTSSRRLQTTPEGIDWLVEYWLELRADLMVEDRVVWTWNHWDRAESLMGNPEGNLRVSRTRALTEAVSGFFANLGPEDGAGLDDTARAAGPGTRSPRQSTPRSPACKRSGSRSTPTRSSATASKRLTGRSSTPRAR